jgi:DNA-binding transcriptional regulator YdaS (Cro superfamily)
MTAAAATETTEYSPDPNKLRAHLRLKNDAALAGRLQVAPPVLSKIRHGRLQVGATLLISMHEESGISLKDLRELMGDRRKHFRGAANSDAAGA